LVAGDGNKRSKDEPAATDCSFDRPYGIAVDEKTLTCFVAERARIRKITFNEYRILFINSP
jgi:hypothetical protein